MDEARPYIYVGLQDGVRAYDYQVSVAAVTGRLLIC